MDVEAKRSADDFKKHLPFMAVLLFFSCCSASSAGTRNKCHIYDTEMVMLTGRISLKVFPRRQNYESVKAGDKPGPTCLLRLTKPICVVPDKNDEVYEREENVTVVHLVLRDGQFKQLNRIMKSGRVTVTGSLFHSHSIYHHAKVLMDVKLIASK